VNACRDHLRHRRVVRFAALDTVEDIAGPDGLAGLADRDQLERAFSRLSPDHRIALVLRYWGDRSVDEIARITGARPGTVKSRLHYGLAALRTGLDAQIGRPRGAAGASRASSGGRS
jgi:RNA polymerase sigma-70 factor, ECF subfamily